jgi:hypothetical protein
MILGMPKREGIPMVPTLTLDKSRDAFTALKDFANLLTFVKDAFAQSQSMSNGEELRLSAEAVAGCIHLLEAIIDGLHYVADTDGCDCQNKRGAA